MAALLLSSLATVIYCNIKIYTMVGISIWMLTLLLEILAMVTLKKILVQYDTVCTCAYLCVSCVMVFLSTMCVPTVKGLSLISSLSPWTTILFSASYCCCSSVTFDIHDCSRGKQLLEKLFLK